MGIKDANNMGAAMAPAAAQTILDYFSDTKEKPQNFDLILTGDLGMVGKTLLLELLEKEGVRFKANGCADVVRFMWEEIL